ncbi:hypothetical protein A7D27_08485 [Pseudomonas sp. 1D4]|nr:hypothetical protein A7D27_08485 [Pseudomonas sp. 1D4]OEC59853.1 hypothetical protein A9G05_10050 [Pseudomonas sp. ENNP23]
MLAGEASGLAEAQAGAFAEGLGGEEGGEDARRGGFAVLVGEQVRQGAAQRVAWSGSAGSPALGDGEGSMGTGLV